MWSEGVIGVPKGEKGAQTAVHYWVKHYEDPGEFGINGGHISKVTLEINGKIVCRYDRGWDVHPKNKAAETALTILLYVFDGSDDDE